MLPMKTHVMWSMRRSRLITSEFAALMLIVCLASNITPLTYLRENYILIMDQIVTEVVLGIFYVALQSIL